MEDIHKEMYFHGSEPKPLEESEHKDKGNEDDGRTRVVLQQDERHGGEHNECCNDLVLTFLQVDIQSAEIACQCQGCAHLGKFGGLELDARPKVNPRGGAFGGLTIDQHDKQTG